MKNRQFLNSAYLYNAWRKMGYDTASLIQAERELSLDPTAGKVIPNCGSAREYKVQLDKGRIKSVYLVYLYPIHGDEVYVVAVSPNSFMNMSDEEKAQLRKLELKLIDIIEKKK